MSKKFLLLTAIIGLVINPLNAAPAFDFSGKVAPSVMFGLDSQQVFNLPFRLVETELTWGGLFWELKGNLAVEMRWRGDQRFEPKLDLREFYVSFYPAFGEIRVGRQIQAWGAVDGNNPTDNLNPYDFYYLFDPGAGRKLGLFALSLDIPGDAWHVYATFLGEHRTSRRPTPDDDFPSLAPPPSLSLPAGVELPIDLTAGPADSQLVEPSNPYGGGLRILRSFAFGDISLSWLTAVDPMFSPYEKVLFTIRDDPVMHIVAEVPGKFGYRRTQVVGGDAVVFWGDFTFRQEGAWFHTRSDPDANVKLTADYSQYVAQIEYETPWDITLMGQYINQHIWRVKDESDALTVDSSYILIEHDFSEDFKPGMGTPYALLGDKVLLFSTKATFWDNSLELRFSALKNLEETGLMTAVESSYSPAERIQLQLGWVYFWAPSDEPENIFSRMRSFAHLRGGISFFF